MIYSLQRNFLHADLFLLMKKGCENKHKDAERKQIKRNSVFFDFVKEPDDDGKKKKEKKKKSAKGSKTTKRANQAPWKFSEKDQKIFEKALKQMKMPGDLSPLRKVFKDYGFFKCYDWALMSTAAGRYLLRKHLPDFGIPQAYINLFCSTLEIMEDLQAMCWKKCDLDHFEQRIIELSIWREIMFPLPYSCYAIHHTLLHLVDTIRRHGPCPVWWNYSAER
jgi:hypothetical protein